MSQRMFDKNKINYSQISSFNGANGRNREGEPGAAPSSLVFHGALFGATSEISLCLTISLVHSFPARL